MSMISSQAGGTSGASSYHNRRPTYYHSSSATHRKSTISGTPTRRINSVATIHSEAGLSQQQNEQNAQRNGFFRNLFSRNGK